MILRPWALWAFLLSLPLLGGSLTPEKLGLPVFPASSIDYGRFLKKDPTAANPEGLLALAYTAYHGGKHDEAKGHLDVFANKFQKKSEWAYALALRAHNSLATGDMASARVDFMALATNKNYKNHPLALDAQVGAAVSHLDVDSAKTVAMLNRVMAGAKGKNPYLLTTRLYLGEALRLTGKANDAVVHFQFALTNTKGFPDLTLFANWRLAQCFESLQKPSDALAFYSKIIEDASARAFELEALAQVAVLAQATGKMEESSDALRAISARYSQTPQAVKARYTLGRRGKDGGQKEEVLTWWGGLTGAEYAKEPWRQEILEGLFQMAREAKDGAKIASLAVQILTEFPSSSAVESVLPDLLYSSYRDNRLDGAVELAKRILSLARFDGEAKREAARYLIVIQEFQKKNLAAAAEAYESWFRLDPPAGLERLAVTRDYVALLTKLGEKEALRRGLTMLYESARSVGERHQAAYQLAQLWVDRDPVKAAALLDECARLKPDSKLSIPALKQQFLLLVKAGKATEAEKGALKFLLIYPEVAQAAPVLKEVAGALEKAGQKGPALRLWQRLKAEYPRSGEAASADEAISRLN